MDLGKDFSPRTHTFLFVDLKKGLGGGGGGGGGGGRGRCGTIQRHSSQAFYHYKYDYSIACHEFV